MSKRIYATKASQANEFSDHDGYGWFKDISDSEFIEMRAQGKIFEVDGHYFAADSLMAAELAAKRAAYSKQETAETVKSFSASTGGGIYPNPGATLKGIATLICVLGIIASIILAVVFGYSTSLWGDFNFGVFFGVLIGGGVLSYLSGLGLAAFGDLVLSANEIKKKLK